MNLIQKRIPLFPLISAGIMVLFWGGCIAEQKQDPALPDAAGSDPAAAQPSQNAADTGESAAEPLAAAAPSDFHITLPPYDVTLPAYPLAFSEEEKAAQRLAGAAAVDRIKKKIAEGQKHIEVPKGIYRYPLKPRESVLTLEGVQDVVLDWSGSEIIAEPTDNKDFRYNGFSMNHCENVTMKNLVYDADPPGAPVGRVVAHNPAEQTFTVEMLPGYGPLRNKGRFLLFDEQGEVLPTSMNSFYNPVNSTDGRITIEVTEEAMRPPSNRFYDLDAQPLIVFENTHAFFHSSQHSKGIVLENITNYSGSQGFWHRDQHGDTVIRNVHFLRRPDTNRLVSDGGSQFTHLAGGPQIQGCAWEYTYDDPINIFGKYALVYKQTGPKQAILSPSWKNFDLHDTIDFYEAGSWNQTMSAKIVAFELLQDKQEKQEALKIHQGNPASGGEPNTSPWVVTFDRDISVNPVDAAITENRRPSGVHISNCTFKGCFTRPVLINGAENVLIENNRFDQSGMSSICVMLDAWFREGPFPRNVVIRNNTIVRANYHTYNARDISVQLGAVYVGYYNVDRSQRIEGRNIEGIVIENNIISESNITGILLSHTRDARITGNRILASGSRTPVVNGKGLPGTTVYGEVPRGAIFLHNVSDVTIKENELEPDLYAGKKIVESKMYENENVTVADHD